MGPTAPGRRALESNRRELALYVRRLLHSRRMKGGKGGPKPTGDDMGPKPTPTGDDMGPMPTPDKRKAPKGSRPPPPPTAPGRRALESNRRELALLLRNLLESRKMKGGPKGGSKPTGDFGPLPTGDFGPLPTGFDDRGPLPTGFDDLGPLPTGFDDLGPLPTGSDLGSLFDALGSSFDAFFDPSYDASFDPVPTTD